LAWVIELIRRVAAYVLSLMQTKRIGAMKVAVVVLVGSFLLIVA
jgi:hypothetical protein